MEFFAAVISGAVNIMKIDFSLYGFTFNFWQIFLWNIVAGIVLWIIFNLWGGW